MKRIGILLLSWWICLTSVQAQPIECQEMRHSQGYIGRLRHRDFLPLRHQVVRRTPSKIVTRNLPPIDSLSIQGGVDLEILGGTSQSKIVAARDYKGLTLHLCGRALYIYYAKSKDPEIVGRPRLKVYMHQLRELSVAGASCIRGHDLETYCGLVIHHCGSGNVCLNGPIHLNRIESSGAALICIPHVVSDKVHIIATNTSTIRLAGDTGLLLIRAFNQSTVDTRFMCSQVAMVQATDNTMVTVKTFGALRAFAGGQSNIYYYVTPAQLLQHSALSGNVLQMGGW